jgi:oligopeptide transport system substrate-binding protein
MKAIDHGSRFIVRGLTRRKRGPNTPGIRKGRINLCGIRLPGSFWLFQLLLMFWSAVEWPVAAETLPPITSRNLEEATRNKILLICEGSEPRTLDPQAATGVPEHHILMSLIEGLVGCHPTDQALAVPGMADHWEHSDDYSVWTFHIGEDRKWSNGDPVTAQDFVFSYKRILTPDFGSYYVDNLFILKGAEDYAKGKLKDFDQVGVKALDDHTLRIELVGPAPYFLSLLQHDSWYPVNPKTILKYGTISTRDTKWTSAGNYVGNGPFILKTWRPNDVIEVVRNPLYWDANTVKLNGINFYSIENISTQDRAFNVGQLHKTEEVQLDKVPYYRLKRPEYYVSSPYNGVYFYTINVSRKPLDNPKIRIALSLAIDREAIVKNITRENQPVATGYTPPGMGDYKPLQVATYDPERARQLLTEAGFPDGKGFPKFDILINTSESHRAIAEAIQQMWKDELNIDIGIANQEWKVYQDTLHDRNYGIARYSWIGDYMDPVTFLDMWTTGNGNNNAGWSNPKYDQLIHQAARTGEAKARLDILHQAEELLLTEAPVIPIYWYTRNSLMQPSVKNWNSLALDNHNYKFIDLQPIEGAPIK